MQADNEPFVMPSGEEMNLRVAKLVRQTRANSLTFETTPREMSLLNLQPFDPEPARQLAARHEALPEPYECRFDDWIDLTIDRGVFCPTLTKVTPFLYKVVDFKPGERMLDAFAGSGLFGVVAGLLGQTAVSFDTSPAAVACAQKKY